MANGHEEIDNLILKEGFKQASPGEWAGQLTGEGTTSTLLDAILTASGVGGMLAKSRKGFQLIPKKAWERVFGPKLGKQLALAMKGKIKGGKMIPDQPFRQGMIGKPVKTPKPETRGWTPPPEKINTGPSFDVGGWKNVAPAQAKKIQSGDKGKWGLLGLLGILGLADRSSYAGGESYHEDAARDVLGKGSDFYNENIYSILEALIPDPDMSGARDMPNDALMNVLRKQLKGTDPDYYEGETPIGLEELAKAIQGDETINYPQHFSNRARSWAK